MTRTRSTDEALTLTSLGADVLRGEAPPTDRRAVFGGHLVGQALAAATATVSDDRAPHSMHSYYLRPCLPRSPIDYRVSRIREGRTFSTRSVEAVQEGHLIFQLSASFQSDEPGLEHQTVMLAAPDPETLPTLRERVLMDPEGWSDLYREWIAFDVRYVDAPRDRQSGPGPDQPRTHVWFRVNDLQSDDPRMHACALAYVSDLTLLSATLVAHRVVPVADEVHMASLDHLLWFHRPCRVDQWLLYEQTSPAASGSRGLAAGQVFTRDGVLVATVMQEGLIRVRS